LKRKSKHRRIAELQITNHKLPILMPSIRSIDVLATAADLFHAAAEEFIRAARTAIGAQGRFSVALSGGSTPKSLYSLLASNYADFAWNRVFLFFGDERHVPPTDPESNYRMVKESLLSKIAMPTPRPPIMKLNFAASSNSNPENFPASI
jgi:6-phosphogluconolactonase/glucosamine-6-phosphate isomerase/deaminase